MEVFAIPALLTLAGLFFTIRNISHLKSEEKLIRYLETSPKGKLWVERFGMEKTMNLTKKYFLPIGTVISIAMFCYGLWAIKIIASSL